MHAIEGPKKDEIMIADGNIFDKAEGPLMVRQTNKDEEDEEMAEI